MVTQRDAREFAALGLREAAGVADVPVRTATEQHDADEAVILPCADLDVRTDRDRSGVVPVTAGIRNSLVCRPIDN